MKNYFEVTSISRCDLERLGYNVENITDEEMEKLAKLMADDYLEQLYWVSMDSIANRMGFKKNEE